MTDKRPENMDDFKHSVVIDISADPDTVEMTKMGPGPGTMLDLTTEGLSDFDCPELGIRAPAVWCGTAAFTLNVFGLQSLSEPFEEGYRVESTLGPVPVLFKLVTRDEWPGVLWLDPVAVDVHVCQRCGEGLPHVH